MRNQRSKAFRKPKRFQVNSDFKRILSFKVRRRGQKALSTAVLRPSLTAIWPARCR